MFHVVDPNSNLVPNFSDFSPMDGSDPPPLSKTLSFSSISPRADLPPLSKPLSFSSISPRSAPRPVTVAPMETLNDAMRGTSISAEAPPRMRGPLKEGDPYLEFIAKASRASLEARKRFIEQLRTGPPRPPVKRARPRREEPEKLYPLFQCFRGHQTCIRCYEHHSKKCRYCCTTEGSVVSWNKEKATKYTDQYSCHEGRGWIIPKEDDFFCPDSSCQICGPLDSVLNHIADAHSMTIQHFSYGDVIRIPLHLVGKYLVLQAEDGTVFVLWVDDKSLGKILSVVCAEQPGFCRTSFTFELTYDLPPVVRSWLRGEHWTPLYYASDPRVKPWKIVNNEIINYGKNTDVTGIANADSNIIRSYYVSSSNLGNMHADNNNCALCVPWTFYDSYRGPKMWYGDLILSISSPPNATKSTT